MSEQKVEAAGREAPGRFTEGNEGGPGNPHARRAAQLQRLLLTRLTDDEALTIFDKLIELAQEGDLPAIKLVMQYTIGKPRPAAELDHPSLADPAPPASGRSPSPVSAKPQGANAPRPSAVPADLMRQVEEAVKMPQALVNLSPVPLAKAVSGRR